MKKYLTFIAVLLVSLAFTAGTGQAAATVASDSVGTASGQQMKIKGVDINNIKISLHVKAVFDKDPNLDNTTKVTNRQGQTRWVLQYADNPSAFDGATLAALGTQKFWKGGNKASTADLSNALGTAAITGEFTDISVKNLLTEARNAHGVPDMLYTYEPIIWVVKMKDGTQAWGGHPNYPGGAYICNNVDDAPQTWLRVFEDKAEAPGQEGCELAAKRK